ncbi:MAG: hypothetical protein ABIZ34_10030 [Candidatus Limnocylindrales bacterium]
MRQRDERDGPHEHRPDPWSHVWQIDLPDRRPRSPARGRYRRLSRRLRHYPRHCRRCGQPLNFDAMPGVVCELCQDDERNRNFIDVEMSTWQEQQEQEANDNEL